MKVTLNVENKFVKFVEEEIDFSQYGIYLITGENGVGKTTIMRDIVLYNSTIEFNKEETKRIYEKERQKVFTYIEQDPKAVPGSAKEYICRCNGDVDWKKVKEYLEIFQLEHLNMKQKVEELSGGERIKLNMIASFLKDTPYLFLDEPTNNLDNDSVEMLIKILNQMKENHTIVIISHDPRLVFEQVQYINIEKSKITTNGTTKGALNEEKCSSTKKAIGKRMILHAKDSFLISSMFLTLTLLMLLGMVNHIVISGWYNTEEMPDTKDVITTYIADGVYGALNKTYSKGANITIDEKNYNNLIRYDDIQEIVENKDVEKVMLSNEIYLDQIAEAYFNHSMNEQLYIASIPYDVIMEHGDSINYCFDIRYLEKGRLPYDNADEVAVSKSLLKQYFGLEDVDNVMGETISIKDKAYKIVGICVEDICVISYTGQDDYGYFEYNSKDYEQKEEKMASYLEEIDATNLNTPSHVIVYTKADAEKRVLDTLMKKYSANNYYSFEYAKIFAKQYNALLNILLIVGNILISILFSIIIGLIYRKGSKLYKPFMETLDYYYVKLGTTKKLFITIRMMEYVLAVLLVTLWIQKISDYERNIYRYFYIDCIIMLIPLLGMYRGERKNAHKNNN